MHGLILPCFRDEGEVLKRTSDLRDKFLWAVLSSALLQRLCKEVCDHFIACVENGEQFVFTLFFLSGFFLFTKSEQKQYFFGLNYCISASYRR